MPAHRLAPLAFSLLASFAAAAPADEDAFVKALPSPGARDHEFLPIPPTLLTRLAIDPASIRSVDPGVVCDPSSQVPIFATTALGHVGQLQTICTPDGWSLGILTLESGASYTTNCGNGSSARLTATLDVTVGPYSWHGSTDSAPQASTFSHTCTGWTKAPG